MKKPAFRRPYAMQPGFVEALIEENDTLRREIRVAREAAEITANLVVKQFEETERVLRRLQTANAQRKAVLDSASQMAIIATNIQGIVIVFNSGAENLLGYRASEIIGQKTPEIFHLDSELISRSERLKTKYGCEVGGIDIFLEYASRGRSEYSEWTYVRKDGTHFPVSMSINTLRDPEGAVSGFLCTAMDITEKKLSEKALEESERNYRLLMNNIPNVVFKGYSDGSIDFYDDKIESLTGYSRDTFVSGKKKWNDLVVEEDLDLVHDTFSQALETGKSYIREYRIRKKNGEIVWVEEGSQIICDEKGDIEFVIGAFLNTTERKVAEKALHESEEIHRSLFNSGPDPIFVLDREFYEILDANPSAEVTYGYSRDELIGRNFSDLGTFDYEEQILPDSNGSDWSRGCFVTQRARHFKKSGNPFFTKVKTCPTVYKGRSALILAATDITELMEKDAQLFQVGKMTTLGEVSAGIAHELNQPLNAIKIGSEFLRKIMGQGKGIPEADFLEVVSEVSRQVDRASDIIKRLREFGRRSDFREEMVNLNSSVKAVTGILGQQLCLQNISIVYELDENLPHVPANKNHLEQVIFNLVTNARDAIEQGCLRMDETGGGTITFRTFCENDWVSLTVSDTGTGIPEDYREKIFEPFFTTKEVGRGMGLGLSIAYGIVRDFGGRIEVHSRKGKGAVFKLALPQAKSQNHERRESR